MKIPQTTIQWIAVLAIFVLLPATAVAQTPQERIDAAMARAQENGIPVSLLASKVTEGQAKGVAADRIAAAVESRLVALQKASEVMGRGASNLNEAQLSVGADAVGLGVSDAVLEKVASAPFEHRAVAVAALTHLVSQGMSSEQAYLKVQDGLSRGPQALANLAAQGEANGRIPEGAGPGAGPAGLSTPAGGPPAAVPAPGQASPPARPSNIPAGPLGQ